MCYIVTLEEKLSFAITTKNCQLQLFLITNTIANDNFSSSVKIFSFQFRTRDERLLRVLFFKTFSIKGP
jgi:hypothetical protein